MLVLSKLTNINHANGGSYDPPLFLYSALFAARGRFGGLPRTAAGFGGYSPQGGALAGIPRKGALWRGFPARRRLWRGFPARRRALAGLPRTAAGFGGLLCTAFSAAAVHSALGRAVFSLFFAYAPGTRQKHPQKFRRLHCRISYCIGKFKKFVKINE